MSCLRDQEAGAPIAFNRKSDISALFRVRRPKLLSHAFPNLVNMVYIHVRVTDLLTDREYILYIEGRASRRPDPITVNRI